MWNHGTRSPDPRRRLCRATVWSFALLLIATAAAGQPSEARGGYWRASGAEGFYRVRVVAGDDSARVEIEWATGGPGGEHIVDRVTVSDLGDGGPWQLGNLELRAEDEMALLLLDAHNPRTNARRTLTLELGAPGVYRLRDR